MHARVIGSALVVVFGLVPTLAGGFAFTALMLLIALVAFQEFCALTVGATSGPLAAFPRIAAASFAVLAIAASVDTSATTLAVIAFLILATPLLSLLPRVDEAQALVQWALGAIGIMYVGIPLYAAIVLRALPGSIDPSWLATVVTVLSRSWLETSRGLAWTLLTMLVIWMGDTAAYLIGRAFGAHKLAPRISPGKTVEGAVGGLVGSALTGAAAFALFGLGPAWIGLLVGAVIGGMGQLGDLCESFIKRQAERKDSGHLIPGHGGMFDRVDALLFAFPTALALVAAMDRLGIH